MAKVQERKKSDETTVLFVYLPKELTDDLGFVKGDVVDFGQTDEGDIVIRRRKESD